jgi:DNA-binding sugar fermentation-stimulating protein
MYECRYDERLKRWVVYYESRKRELKIRLMNEGRCDERLQAGVEESTCLFIMNRYVNLLFIMNR